MAKPGTTPRADDDQEPGQPGVSGNGGFGVLLRAYRKGALLSQEELAERAGLSDRTIRDLERGAVRRPHGASVRCLADALGLQEDQRAAFEEAARESSQSAGRGVVREDSHRDSGMAPARAYRKQALLTQEQLADRSALGVRTIRQLGTGRAQPHYASLRLLADALGLTDQEREALTGTEQAAPGADLPAPAGPVCQLPMDVAGFTGRAANLAELDGLLPRDPAAPSAAVMIAAIAGKAGVGKTALAVHWAHRVRERFPDGQLYVNLGAADAHPADLGEVLDWLLRALGVHGSAIPAGIEQRAALYRARLEGRRVLVVLDNAAGEGQVRPLLPGSPACGVLVTSRARLGGLQGAHLVDLDVLDPDQAVVLLGRIAGADRVGAEPAAAERIVRLCGLLPLAVRVAAARLVSRTHRSLGWLAGRLADERRRLDELTHGDLEVRASLALSYHTLDAEQRRAFRLLGIVDAPDFAAWAASALLDTPVERAEELVDELVDAQLVEVASYGSGGVRWRFHDLLRVYARELAAAEPPGERDAALERLLGACLILVEQANLRGTSTSWGVLRGGARRWPLPAEATDELLADPAAWLQRERRLLVSAVGLACDAGLDEAAWELATSPADTSAEPDRYVDDWRNSLELALAATRRAGNRRGEAAVLRELGLLYGGQDRLAEAVSWFEQAKAVFEKVGDRYGAALAEASLGVMSEVLGHRSEALDHLCRALAVLRAAGDQRSQVYVLRALGAAELERDRPGNALGRLGEGLAVARRAGYRYGEGHLLRWLARAHARQGENDRATALLEQAQAIFGQLGARHGEVFTLADFGDLYLRQGQVEQARAMLDRSLGICRELGDPLGEVHTLRHLGMLHVAQACPDQAIGCLRRALTLAKTIGRPLLVARVLASLGEAHEAAGDRQAARVAWREAVDLFRQLQMPEAATLGRRLAEPPTSMRSGRATRQPS